MCLGLAYTVEYCILSMYLWSHERHGFSQRPSPLVGGVLVVRSEEERRAALVRQGEDIAGRDALVGLQILLRESKFSFTSKLGFRLPFPADRGSIREQVACR